jgi:hypothetical protein
MNDRKFFAGKGEGGTDARIDAALDGVVGDKTGGTLWIDKFTGECWSAVNRLAGGAEVVEAEVEGKVADSADDLNTVRLSEGSTLRYCLEQLEMVKAMAVDPSVSVEVARAKADFLSQFIMVVITECRIDPRIYIRIRQNLLRTCAIIDMRRLGIVGAVDVSAVASACGDRSL